MKIAKHVKKALESLPFITGARADHKTGRVSITYSSQPDEAAMKQVLAKADYEYKGILFPKEETNMKETVKIEGMMCNHCEMTVKKALEALDGVEKADVSHTKGTAVLTLDKAVADGDIKKAIEDKDYTFKGIENKESKSRETGNRFTAFMLWKSKTSLQAGFVVPEAGLEPARCCHRQILSLVRLPFRHSGISVIILSYRLTYRQ